MANESVGSAKRHPSAVGPAGLVVDPLADGEDGQVVFGDPDTRFTEFVGLLLETVTWTRAGGFRAVIQ